MLQMRPMESDGKADRFYSPHRDLAHIGAQLVRRAVMFIDQGKGDAGLQEYLKKEGVTEDQLVEAVGKLRDMLNLIIDAKHPAEAMQQVDFESLPFAARLPFFYTLGQVTFASIWSAVKDVSAANSGLPRDIKTLVAAMEDAMSAFHNHPV